MPYNIMRSALRKRHPCTYVHVHEEIYVFVPTILSRIHIYHSRVHIYVSSRKQRKEMRDSVTRSRTRSGNVYAGSRRCRRLMRRNTLPSRVIAYILGDAATTGCARRVSVRGTQNMFYSLLRDATPSRA